MRVAELDFVQFRRNLTKPCSALQTIGYRYSETDLRTGDGMFVVDISLPETFKEIIQIRALGFRALIGNSGGYIGLFCGKSLSVFTSYT